MTVSHLVKSNVICLDLMLSLVAQAYNFTTSGPGEYYIEANNLFYRVLDSGEVDTIWAESEAQATTLTGTLGIAFSIGSPSLANFVGCSASRQAVINAGIAGAEQYALASYECVIRPSVVLGLTF